MRYRLFNYDSVYCHPNYIWHILLITTRNGIDSQFSTRWNLQFLFGLANNIVKILLVSKNSFPWVSTWVESNSEINQSKVTLLATNASFGQPTCLYPYENLSNIVSETSDAEHMKHFTTLVSHSALTFYCYRVHRCLYRPISRGLRCTRTSVAEIKCCFFALLKSGCKYHFSKKCCEDYGKLYH